MSAIIYDFNTIRKSSKPIPPDPPIQPNTTLRDHIKDVITQTITEDYATWPVEIVERAIQAATGQIDQDGTLLDAIDAAEQVFIDGALDTDRERLRLLLKTIKRRRASFLELAIRTIRQKLRGKASFLEQHRAIGRARRVIDDGGTVGAALRAALGKDWLT